MGNIIVETRPHDREALALNMQFAIGALAVEQGYLFLKATAPLGPLDAQPFCGTSRSWLAKPGDCAGCLAERKEVAPGDLFKD